MRLSASYGRKELGRLSRAVRRSIALHVVVLAVGALYRPGVWVAAARSPARPCRAPLPGTGLTPPKGLVSVVMGDSLSPSSPRVTGSSGGVLAAVRPGAAHSVADRRLSTWLPRRRTRGWAGEIETVRHVVGNGIAVVERGQAERLLAELHQADMRAHCVGQGRLGDVTLLGIGADHEASDARSIAER